MTSLKWIKCKDSVEDELIWCNLERVNLKTVTATGVYIIWHEGNPSRVVRIGQGNIADRLSAHRNNDEILLYKKFGALRVTWAAVVGSQMDGVERYLADHWVPLVGDAFPDADPIEVNSPW